MLELQLGNLAFLSQTRVRLLDVGGRLVAESAAPGASRVSLGAVPLETYWVTSNYRKGQPTGARFLTVWRRDGRLLVVWQSC